MSKEKKSNINMQIYSMYICDWQNYINLNKSEEIFLQLGMFVKCSKRTYLSSDMYKV